jgi:hypothetical protein
MDIDRPHIRQLTEPSGKLSPPLRVFFKCDSCLHVSRLRSPLGAGPESLISAPARSHPVTNATIDRRLKQRKTYKEPFAFFVTRFQVASPRSNYNESVGMPLLGTDPDGRYCLSGLHRGLNACIKHIPAATSRWMHKVRCPVCCFAII